MAKEMGCIFFLWPGILYGEQLFGSSDICSLGKDLWG